MLKLWIIDDDGTRRCALKDYECTTETAIRRLVNRPDEVVSYIGSDDEGCMYESCKADYTRPDFKLLKWKWTVE